MFGHDRIYTPAKPTKYGMTSLLPPVAQQYSDENGVPLAGGTIDFYQSGTLTRKTVWADSTQSSALTNPVVLDASGSAVIFGAGAYRAILKNAAGVTIWDGNTSGALPDGAVSTVMLPLLGSSTLQEFLDNSGVTAAIGAANTYAAGLVAAEAATRSAADVAEASTRAGEDSFLQGQITANYNANVATENALQVEINTLNSEVAGLSTIPSGVILLQTGSGTTSDGTFTISFPFSFPTWMISFGLSYFLPTGYSPGAFGTSPGPDGWAIVITITATSQSGINGSFGENTTDQNDQPFVQPIGGAYHWYATGF